MFITYDCVLMNVVYMNFSDIDSKPLTGCIKGGIFVLVMKESIFIVSVISTYHTLWKVLKETRGKLSVHFHIQSHQLFHQRKSVPQHVNENGISKSKVWRKNINYLNE